MSKRAPNPALPAAIDAAPEFPRGHVDTPPSEESLTLSRRGLLGAMAATFAVVGAEGCRRPIEKVVPYTKMPEDVIPGVPSHFATVIQRRGDALGVVLESHEGRPTKVEGNEAHPSSFGAADLVAQASILELYDPDRSTSPRKAGAPASWDAFEKELGAKLAGFDKDQGAKLRLLMPPTVSPTVIRMRATLAQRFPKARVHTWSPIADSNVRAGAKAAFGEVVNTLYAFDRARVILSLDSDFLQTESGNVRATKLFAAGRRLRSSRDAMSRLYVVEPARTTTGNAADHRLRLPAGDIAAYAFALRASWPRAAWRSKRRPPRRRPRAASRSRRSGSRRSRRSCCRAAGARSSSSVRASRRRSTRWCTPSTWRSTPCRGWSATLPRPTRTSSTS